MKFQSIIYWINTVFLSTFLELNCVQSIKYFDCTEEIGRNIIEINNGTIQLEYTHYPGFWLSQVVDQNKKALQWSFVVKEENSNLSPSFVTIMDSNQRSYISKRQNRYVEYVWSWKIIGEFNKNYKNN